MKTRIAALALTLLAAGCYTSEPPPVLEPTGTEVTIFVPGIKGSFLVDQEGTRAWLEAEDLLSEGEQSLALPPGGEDRFGALHPEGVLTRFSIIPFTSYDVYLPWLEYGAENLPGFLPFAYDWRYDAHETVLALAKKIDALVEKQGADLKVNLVGHSLGGLIALTYVRYGDGDPKKGVTWAGAKHVKRLVLAGAPFQGSPSFLQDILQGDTVGRNTRLLAPEAMASFASAWELLPMPGTFFVDEASAPVALDAADDKTWERLPPGRRPQAASLEAWRAFRAGLKDEPEALAPPRDLQVLAVAGIGRPTIEKVMLARPEEIDSADFERSPTASGDGRVPAESCVPPRPLRYRLIPTRADHVNLLNDEAVQRAIGDFLVGESVLRAREGAE